MRPSKEELRAIVLRPDVPDATVEQRVLDTEVESEEDLTDLITMMLSEHRPSVVDSLTRHMLRSRRPAP